MVFDFGGVLLDWDPRHLYRKFFGSQPEAMERFLAEIGFAEWNREQDKGRDFALAVAELSERFPQHAALIRAYDERWEESIAGPMQSSITLLDALRRAGYPLYGLSNWSAEKFQLVRPRYAFFDWFQMIMISGEVSLIKPDPRIFQKFLEVTSRNAGECLFIDDAERNVLVAQELGFQAIQFKSAEELARELIQRGLLAEGDVVSPHRNHSLAVPLHMAQPRRNAKYVKPGPA